MRLHERLLRTQRLRGGMQPCIRLASLGGWRVEARRLRRQVKARRVGAASDFYELLQRAGGQRVHRQERIEAAVLADAGHLCARNIAGHGTDRRRRLDHLGNRFIKELWLFVDETRN